jgi:hypothetical protein
MAVGDGILSMWVVYKHPADMPAHYVARRHDVNSGRSTPTAYTCAAATLDGVREMLPEGLTRLDRFEDDEPHIVEVWL